MKIALCNEVLMPLPFQDQCRLAAGMGYDAIELAPFTVADDPSRMTDEQARQIASIARDHGLTISGLHWLLVAPDGLSIASPDAKARLRTTHVMERLVDICAVMGGRYLVHGSPRQRSVPEGSNFEQTWERARDCLTHAAARARDRNVVYCIEPLSTGETDVINTVAQAMRMVTEIDSPGFKTMVDCSAAGQVEKESVADLISRWAPTGHIAHIQVNDPNRRGPGQGAMSFGPILRSVHAMRQAGHYHGVLAVEPFDYQPDGPGCAAYSLGYLRGILQEIENDG